MFELFTAIAYGALLSFGLIAPLGMQNLFILNQGASQTKFRNVLPSVITAGLCDTALILMAVLGVSLIILEVAWLKVGVYGFGFLFLVYMGFSTWKQSSRSASTDKDANAPKIVPLSWQKQVVFATSVSLLNPHAIIDSVAVIGTNSAHYESYPKLAFCLSTVLVSWIWFSSLAIVGHRLNKLDNKGSWLSVVNRLASLVIFGVAFFIGIELYTEITGWYIE